MPLFRTTALIVVVPLFISISVAAFMVVAPPVPQNVDGDMDRSIKAGDDFYRFANGGWLKTAPIPAGLPSYDTRSILTERTSRRVRDLIQAAAAQHASKGSIAQKVGDYYSSFMDEDGIGAKGLTPLAGELDRISGIANKASLSVY